MLLLMPGMFIIGRASSITMLYVGLVLFSFGKLQEVLMEAAEPL